MKGISIVALAALAASLAALFPSGAAGEGPVAVNVRVATFQGKVLADRRIVTGTTTVQTSKKAKCLGGRPTNGSEVVEGPTALGALTDLGERVPRLDPLILSGAFDFGIGVCGVGRFTATGTQWWALKVNGALSATGGDSTVLEKGDRVLWYLDRSFEKPFPAELRIREIGKRTGPKIRVKVAALDSTGRVRPATRARIFSGGREVAVTGGRGRATFTVPSAAGESAFVVARRGGSIPSNRIEVGDVS
jgi:hypothetical protein